MKHKRRKKEYELSTFDNVMTWVFGFLFAGMIVAGIIYLIMGGR